MAILEELRNELVEVSTRSGNAKYFKAKGYKIPQKIDTRGRTVTDYSKNIFVKVEDLSKSSRVKLTKVCDDCGIHICNQTYSNITRNRRLTDGLDRCVSCGKRYAGITKRSNVPYEKSLEYFCQNANKNYILEEFNTENNESPRNIYKSSRFVYIWACLKCKSNYYMSVDERTRRGSNCPYCNGSRVNLTNCLWTTHPEIAKLLENKNVGYNVTYGSDKKLNFKCERCDTIKNKSVNNVVTKGVACHICSDDISYPEKFIICVLRQLEVDFDFQKVFEWHKGKRYDFYIPHSDCIIETHGDQHYKYGWGKLPEDVQNIDKIKEDKANKNGVKVYIVIDCRKSKLEWIKCEALASNLSKIFDLSKIDWNKCHEFACNSLVREACFLWNKGLKSACLIGENLKLGEATIRRYLCKGSKVGWCNYDSKTNRYRPVVQMSTDGEFISYWENIVTASKELGLIASKISDVCRGNRITTGGFRWMYRENYESNKSNIKDSFKVDMVKKPIVQLTVGGEFICNWRSITEAKNSLGFKSTSGISEACRNPKATAGGFKWMYEKDFQALMAT